MSEPQDADMTVHERLDSMQRIGQTAAAQLVWLVAKVLVTLFVSGAIALGTGYVKDMRDDLRTVSTKVEAQNTKSQLQQQSMDGLAKVTDATVLALQSLSKQVDHNTYDVNALKAAAEYNAKHARP